MNLRDTRSYSGHTRSKLPTKFLKFQLFRRIFGRFYPLWTCIFWVYVSWSCFMPKWQKYFSFWILQKSKNWFDILNFWFSHIHDYLDPWLFGSQEYPVSWLEFHRNYYCRMTSRKIQLLNQILAFCFSYQNLGEVRVWKHESKCLGEVRVWMSRWGGGMI